MIKRIIRKMLFPNTYSSDAYINYLRKKGVTIGDGCYIWSPNHTFIDIQNSCMLEIGNYVKIALGVKILNHDYSVSVARQYYKKHVGQAKVTHIGNNVFIGMDSIILPGTIIGNNVIIGAGSVVHGVIPDNTVVAGNPATVISSLDNFFKKKKIHEIDQAKSFVYNFYKKNKKIPTVENMGNAFFWLYMPRNQKVVNQYNKMFNLSGDNKENVIKEFLNDKPVFDSYNNFLEEIIEGNEYNEEDFKKAIQLFINNHKD